MTPRTPRHYQRSAIKLTDELAQHAATMKREGRSIREIAAALQINRITMREKLVAMGAYVPSVKQRHTVSHVGVAKPDRESDARLPMPAGHPVSWGLITLMEIR